MKNIKLLVIFASIFLMGVVGVNANGVSTNSEKPRIANCEASLTRACESEQSAYNDARNTAVNICETQSGTQACFNANHAVGVAAGVLEACKGGGGKIVPVLPGNSITRKPDKGKLSPNGNKTSRTVVTD